MTKTATAPRRPLSATSRILLIGLLSAAVALAFGWTGLGKRLEQLTLDMRFVFRRELSIDPQTKRPGHIHPQITLIGIGDGDLDAFGKWPWPRAFQARMLGAFTNKTCLVRAVGYDVLFTTTDQDAKSRKSDAKFSEIIREMGNVCLAGTVRKDSAVAGDSSTNEVDYSWVGAQSLPADGSPPNTKLESETGIVQPALLFRDGSHFGLINAIRDKDGVHRRMPILVRQGDHWLPSLSLRLAMLYYEVDLTDLAVESDHTVVLKRSNGPPLRIPVEPYEEVAVGQDEQFPIKFLVLRVNYRGTLRPTVQAPLGDFANASFAGVVDWVEGKSMTAKEKKYLGQVMDSAHNGIVVIGHTMTGVDMGATPLHPGTALVDCHLNVINNLLTGDFLKEVADGWVWLFTLVLSLIPAWAMQKLSGFKGSAVTVAPVLVFLVVAWILFDRASVWVPMVVPSTGWLLAFTSSTILRFTGEERQKRQLRRTMQNYLSANIMDEVLKNPDAMKMGGVRKELTVMFTDVRGFTTFCEKNEPEKVVPVLNELLEVASEVVIRHDGTLDKYIGDAIMAFWGAPTTGKMDHAEAAARTALEMRDALDALRKDWEKRGIPPLHLGVGINTGSMLVGNVGSSRLRNYTVIGDEVNLGARLESETRKFDTDIIISESTANHLGTKFKTRYLAEVTVKGKQKPVRIYALEGFAEKT